MEPTIGSQHRSGLGFLLASLSLVLITCLTGCGGHNSSQVSVLIEKKPFTGFVAGVEVGGTLNLVAGTCVGFTWARKPTVIVFPAGTSVTGHGQDLVIHAEGHDLTLGGGFAGGAGPGAPSVTRLPSAITTTPPKACGHFPAVYVSQFLPLNK
jgi:hypothetical protein